MVKRVILIFCFFVSTVAFGSDRDGATRVLILGDSLTAGFGLEQDEAFPAQLEDWLNARGHNIDVINAGVSGDTTTGGRARLAWVLDGQPAPPDLVVVALGGNDILRSLPISATRDNLDAILETLDRRDIPAMLAGMLAAPNLGPDYETAFNAIYPDLAEKHGTTLYPFFLDGVATRPDLHQADGLHPNAEGVAAMVERFGPALVAALQAEKTAARDVP